jgi:hypothetical protein
MPRSQTGATLWSTAYRQVGGSLFDAAAERVSQLIDEPSALSIALPSGAA